MNDWKASNSGEHFFFSFLFCINSLGMNGRLHRERARSTAKKTNPFFNGITANDFIAMQLNDWHRQQLAGDLSRGCSTWWTFWLGQKISTKKEREFKTIFVMDYRRIKWWFINDDKVSFRFFYSISIWQLFGAFFRNINHPPCVCMIQHR